VLKNSIGAACATVLVALAGGLATPTASHAAVYGGVFDPENTFYQWSGTHRFVVDDACLNTNGWKAVNYEGTCGSVSLTGGSLKVKNKTVSAPYGYEETILFGANPPWPVEGPGYPIFGINVVNNELVGVDSTEFGAFRFIGPAFAPNPFNGSEFASDPLAAVIVLPNPLSGDWFLRWDTGLTDCQRYEIGCPLGAIAESAVSPAAANPPMGAVFLRNFVNGGFNGNVPPMSLPPTFERLDAPMAIPEPATVTLVLAALGAGWLARRRAV